MALVQGASIHEPLEGSCEPHKAKVELAKLCSENILVNRGTYVL